MGMFDYIQCRLPVPGMPQDETFQTKDLSCLLDEILIQDSGLVTKRVFELERVPRRDLPADFDSLSVLQQAQLRERIRPGSERQVIVDYTGDLVFYTSLHSRWFEYCARVVNGVCEEIQELRNDNWVTLWQREWFFPDPG